MTTEASQPDDTRPARGTLRGRDMTTKQTETVMGKTVQHDLSGQGHCWRAKDACDLPSDIRLEIEGEIGGGKSSGEIVASNGQRYRWS